MKSLFIGLLVLLSISLFIPSGNCQLVNMSDNHFPVQAGRLTGNNVIDENSSSPYIFGFFSWGSFGGWFQDNQGSQIWGVLPRNIAEGPILSNSNLPTASHMDVPWGLCQMWGMPSDFPPCMGSWDSNPLYSREFLQPTTYGAMNYGAIYQLGNSNLADVAVGTPSTFPSDYENPYSYLLNCTKTPAGFPIATGCFDSNEFNVATTGFTGTATLHYPVTVSEPFHGTAYGYLKKPRFFMTIKYKSGIPPNLGGRDWNVYHTAFARRVSTLNAPYYELNGFHVKNGDIGAPVYVSTTDAGNYNCEQLVGHIMAGNADNVQAQVEGGRAIVQSWEYAEKPALLATSLGQSFNNLEPAGSCIPSTRKPFDATFNNGAGAYSSLSYSVDSNGQIPPETANGYIVNAQAPLITPLFSVANTTTGANWMTTIAKSSLAINSIGLDDNGAVGSNYAATMNITYVCSSLPEDAQFSDCTDSPSVMQTKILNLKNSAGVTFANYLYNTYGVPASKVVVEREVGFDESGAMTGLSTQSTTSNIPTQCTEDPWLNQENGLIYCTQ